jgi:FkbM family methyltransferase
MIKVLLGKLKRTIKSNKSAKDRAFVALYSIKFEEGDIAIDCGANVGNVSNYLCKSGATVYAFEPNPHAFKVLAKRLSKYPNAHCYRKAVLDHKATTKLYFHNNSDMDELLWSTGSSLLHEKANVRKDKFVEVQAIDLSEFIVNLQGNIKLLKLDVEGVEHSILTKLINHGLHKRIEHIFVETHEEQAHHLQSATRQIKDLIKSMNITNINLDW